MCPVTNFLVKRWFIFRCRLVAPETSSRGPTFAFPRHALSRTSGTEISSGSSRRRFVWNPLETQCKLSGNCPKLHTTHPALARRFQDRLAVHFWDRFANQCNRIAHAFFCSWADEMKRGEDWLRSGLTLGALWLHSELTLGSLCAYSGLALGSLWLHSLHSGLTLGSL